MILYNVARPTVSLDLRTLGSNPEAQYLFVSLDRFVVFPSASDVRNKINKMGMRQGEAHMPLVLDCRHISNTDFTAAKGFKSMIADFRKRNQPIIFYNTTQSVMDTFLGVKIEEFVFAHSPEDLNELLQRHFDILPALTQLTV